MPIYINIVPDPVERIISRFYYIRRRFKRDSPGQILKMASWLQQVYNLYTSHINICLCIMSELFAHILVTGF